MVSWWSLEVSRTLCRTISQEILRNCLRYLPAKRLASDRSLTLKKLLRYSLNRVSSIILAWPDMILNLCYLFSQVVVLCLGLGAVAHTPGLQKALTSA